MAKKLIFVVNYLFLSGVCYCNLMGWKVFNQITLFILRFLICIVIRAYQTASVVSEFNVRKLPIKNFDKAIDDLRPLFRQSFP